MNNTCVCILTNQYNEYIVNRILKINEQLVDADLWILYDGDKSTTDKRIIESNINVFYIDKNEMVSLRITNENTDYRKNCHSFMVYFYYKHKEYDFYYFFEKDVLYTGNYNELVNNYKNDYSDILIQNNANYRTGKVFDNVFLELFDDIGNGLSSIENAFPNCISEMRLNDKTAKDYPYKILFQLYRCSNKLLNLYYKLITEDKVFGVGEWALCAIILEYNISYNLFKEKTYTYFCGERNINYDLENVNLSNTFIHNKALTESYMIIDDRNKFLCFNEYKTHNL